MYKTNQRQMWLQRAICRVGENGQIGKTVWKINPKQNEIAAISKVKPSILKQIQIKLMVAKSVFKDNYILFVFKRGCPKRAPSYCLNKVGFVTRSFSVYINRTYNWHYCDCIFFECCCFLANIIVFILFVVLNIIFYD